MQIFTFTALKIYQRQHWQRCSAGHVYTVHFVLCTLCVCVCLSGAWHSWAVSFPPRIPEEGDVMEIHSQGQVLPYTGEWDVRCSLIPTSYYSNTSVLLLVFVFDTPSLSQVEEQEGDQPTGREIWESVFCLFRFVWRLLKAVNTGMSFLSAVVVVNVLLTI